MQPGAAACWSTSSFGMQLVRVRPISASGAAPAVHFGHPHGNAAPFELIYQFYTHSYTSTVSEHRILAEPSLFQCKQTTLHQG